MGDWEDLAGIFLCAPEVSELPCEIVSAIIESKREEH